MSIEQLFQDYGIPFTTEGKHSTKGWINIRCPFCGGEDHMGIKDNGRGAHCWICGTRPAIEVLSLTLGKPEATIRQILPKYIRLQRQSIRKDAPVSILPLRFPKPNYALSGR